MSNEEAQTPVNTRKTANTPIGLSRFYNKVFDLLVKIGGAPESMRSNFVYIHAEPESDCDEYRFQGKLGFGGKYRRKTNRVDCYREDESPNRLKIIERLNSMLQALERTESVRTGT